MQYLTAKIKHYFERYGLVLLLASAALLFARVIGYPFLQWDDNIYVTARSTIQCLAAKQLHCLTDLLSPRQALAGKFWEYLPIRDLSYGLEALAGGISAPLFHSTNLVLHLLNICLVFFIGRFFNLSRNASLSVAALWGLHPIAVEPVAWVSDRKDLLLATFVLGATLALLKFMKKPEEHFWRYFGLFAGCTLFAMGSKGPGPIALLIALTIAFFWAERSVLYRLMKWTTPLVLLSLLWLWLMIQIGLENQIFLPEQSHHPTTQTLLRVLVSPMKGLVSFLAPLALSPDQRAGFSTIEQIVLAIASVLFILLVVTNLLKEKRTGRISPITLSLLLYLATVFPISGIVKVNQAHAIRFYYLPTVFLALGFVTLVNSGKLRRQFRLLTWLVPLLLPTYAGLSHAYLQAWKSDVDLWKYVLSLEPDNYLALTNLAGIAIEQGHFEVAKRLLDQAHTKAPHSPVLWSNYGYYWLYQAQNSSNKQPSGSNKQPPSSLPMAAQPSIATVSLEQSITSFQNALRLEPGRTLALLGLAKAYQQQGNFHQAYRLYVEAQQKQDGWERATEALYGLLWSKGRKNQARQTVITAIQTLGSSTRLQQLLKRDQPNTH